MKEGQLYYLSNPDGVSLRTVVQDGDGYLWVATRADRNGGGRCRSVATGVETYFDESEMEPVDET